MPAPARDLARRLNSATVHLMRALRKDGPRSGLAAEHRSALTAVVFGGRISIGELARSEQVGAPAMTKTVGVLEAEGLARRVPDMRDGRIVRVEATNDGKAFVLRGRDQRVARIGRALADLDKVDTTRLEAAIGALERLVADLENAAPSPQRAPRRRAHART